MATVVKGSRPAFRAKIDPGGLKVTERVKGDATTDFGAPSIISKLDRRPLDAKELRRLTKILQRCWDTLDHIAAGSPPKIDDADPVASQARMRGAALGALDRAVAESMPKAGPRGGKLWTPRYFIRRAVWHVLDHAWEIEDRAG